MVVDFVKGHCDCCSSYGGAVRHESEMLGY